MLPLNVKMDSTHKIQSHHLCNHKMVYIRKTLHHFYYQGLNKKEKKKIIGLSMPRKIINTYFRNV